MKYKILIIEDDDAIRDLLSLLLSQEFDISLAIDGEDGLSAYKMVKPDVVLMDLVMPKISGLQAAKNILDYDKKAKIIMITVHAEDGVKEAALNVGISDYLLKPIDHGKLVESIEHVLNIEKIGSSSKN